MTDRPTTCMEAGCDQKPSVRGLCRKHYNQHFRRGDLDEVGLPPLTRSDASRAGNAKRKQLAEARGKPLPLQGRPEPVALHCCNCGAELQSDRQDGIHWHVTPCQACQQRREKNQAERIDEAEAELSSLRAEREDWRLASLKVREALHGPLGLGLDELDTAGMAERAAAVIGELKRRQQAAQVIDPACGSGGFLGDAAQHLLRQSPDTYGAWLDQVEAGAWRWGVRFIQLDVADTGTAALSVRRGG